MAEESAGLTQRVEALEQISHVRVVERIGQIEQRVSRIESAREAEEPYVATKAVKDNRRKRKPYKSKLEWDLFYIQAWMVTFAIAIIAVILAAFAIIVAQLP